MKNYASFPPSNLEKNPFMVLLDDALKKHGWTQTIFTFKVVNLLRYRRAVSILYFHWPESIWRSSSVTVSWLKAILFAFKTKLARRLNYRIVWSVHNVMPHHYKSEKLEVFMRNFLIANVDLLIFHSLNGKADLIEKFQNISFTSVTALHGHYEELYQPDGKMDRHSLGIALHDKVFLMFAKNRGKEGEDSFLSQWIARSRTRAHLIISGTLSAASEQRISGIPGIIYQKGFKLRPRVGDLMKLADILVLPYDRITTSGMFFLAVTFGKPILAPDLDFFRMHMANNGGILYASTAGIGEAIDQAMDRVFDESAILEQKKKYNWNRSAIQIAEAFNKIVC
jgi:beta-1,4-mannosyltransferase